MRLMAMDGINLPAKSLLGFEHQSQLEPFSRLFFVVLFFSILDMKIFHKQEWRTYYEKCLTQTERQEKKAAIRYLRGELKERLDYLNGEPDNLCKAYQAIIESVQRQIGAKDVVEETHSVLRAEQISFKAMLRIFNFFAELTPDERDVVIEASKNGEFDGEFDGNGWE